MKLSKRINILPLVLITLIFNSYSSENNNNGWLSYAKSTLFNGYSGLKQLLTATIMPGTGFSELPIEVQTTIIQLFAKSCADTTLKESAQTINSLARTNTLLNNLINDPEIDLELIKNRAKKFDVADTTAAKAFQTKASKHQFKIQLALATIMKNVDEIQEMGGVLPKLDKLLKGFKLDDKLYKVDLDFTYRWNKDSEEYSSPLMYAIKSDNTFLMQYLLKNGANINQTGFNGKTPLMYAHNAETITFLTKQPGLNINQQDASGNTALLRAIQNYFPEDIENRDQDIAVIQTLLEHKANPIIANDNGDTPLKAAQATGDQEVIDIIEQAIAKTTDKIEL